MRKRYTFSLNLIKNSVAKWTFPVITECYYLEKKGTTLFICGLFPIAGEFTTVVMVEITTGLQELRCPVAMLTFYKYKNQHLKPGTLLPSNRC